MNATWVVYRRREFTPGFMSVRPRVLGRWVGPALVCTSVETACALIPVGADVHIHWSATS